MVSKAVGRIPAGAAGQTEQKVRKRIAAPAAAEIDGLANVRPCIKQNSAEIHAHPDGMRHGCVVHARCELSRRAGPILIPAISNGGESGDGNHRVTEVFRVVGSRNT